MQGYHRGWSEDTGSSEARRVLILLGARVRNSLDPASGVSLTARLFSSSEVLKTSIPSSLNPRSSISSSTATSFALTRDYNQLTVGRLSKSHHRCAASGCEHPNGASGNKPAELSQGPEALWSAEAGPGAFEQAQASRLGIGGEKGSVEPGPASSQQVCDEGLGKLQGVIHFVAVAGRSCELSLPQIEIVLTYELVDGIGPVAWPRPRIALPHGRAGAEPFDRPTGLPGREARPSSRTPEPSTGSGFFFAGTSLRWS